MLIGKKFWICILIKFSKFLELSTLISILDLIKLLAFLKTISSNSHFLGSVKAIFLIFSRIMEANEIKIIACFSSILIRNLIFF